MTKLALEMARSFQAQAVAALAAGALDRAGKAEARFSSLFLAIRRVVALGARLRRQQQEAASLISDAAAMLSELMELAMALATGFQAVGVAALAAGDLDRAGDMETRFSSLFLGIRRAVVLKIKLREQREKARREAEVRRKSRQAEKDNRRQAVAQGVAQVIATAPDTDTRERLTVDLWEKLTEDERIDVDLTDTALPIEALIASLCRALGLPPGGMPPAGGPAASSPAAAAKAGTDAAGVGPKRQFSGPASRRASSSHPIAAEDTGDPGDDQPSGDTGPPATAPPRDRRQWTDADRAGHPGRDTERNARWRRPQSLAPMRRHG
ncbi:hypothetical protein FFK22_009265 [Mycobacterium sp. KBS0706]|uniref:hypothetical protein n=1 Tax=Mycobacterium sp. KBS0706 TaxID=2578109 RepID=UPI00110FBC1E|nr:hypothetical protein [Mycobacterium sp. KBS0706]TSD89153.1 hypothetical protein FFK22_009265 [Mycobacterium sp. KBS0706]